MDCLELETYDIPIKGYDYRYLEKLNKQNKIEIIERYEDKVRIKFTSYVGQIALTSLTIRVRPKIHNLSFLYLLVKSLRISNLKIFTEFNQAQNESIREDQQEFLLLFTHILDHFLQHDLRRDYKIIQEEIISPKGKLMFTQIVRNGPSNAHRLACEFDDFTFDVKVNQLIRYTIHHMVHLTRDHGILRKLRSMERKMQHVELLSRIDLAEFDTLALSRAFAHYSSVLAFCQLILQNQGIGMREGAIGLSSFLINMNSLYENFLFTAFKTYFTGYSVRKETVRITGQMDTEHRILVTKPDIRIRKQSQVRLVIDAKYKHFDFKATQISHNTDFYQALSYALFTESPNAVLCYPITQEPWEHPILFEFDKYGVKVLICAIPLFGSTWSEIDIRVNQVLESLSFYDQF